jgi:hypothetical protein
MILASHWSSLSVTLEGVFQLRTRAVFGPISLKNHPEPELGYKMKNRARTDKIKQNQQFCWFYKLNHVCFLEEKKVSLFWHKET